VIDDHGTDIVFQIKRNWSVQTEGEDSITGLKVAIPLGTSSSCLFRAVPHKYDARMVNNARLLAIVRSEKSNVIVELTPKSVTKMSSFDHNDNVSFVIKNVKINKGASDVTITIVESYKDWDGKAFSATGYINHVNAEKKAT